MAEFLTTSGTSYHIENIIIEAKSKLFLISPYLQISKTLFERLKDASSRNVYIKIIFGKDQLNPKEKENLALLKNIELFYFNNLHAKCYFNESKMVITSMNMYEFSEKNNREMGVLINSTTDKELFEKAVFETQSIIQSSEIIHLAASKSITPEYKYKMISNNNTKQGYCIRCSKQIKFDINKPMCNECLNIWSVFCNYEYPENYCHKCGKNEETFMNKPLDYECFNIWIKE